MKFSTLNELKEIAIAISNTISVKYLGKIESFDPSPYIGLTKRYSVENNTIAFFTDSALYVLPYFRNATKILNANLYKSISVDVPFANGEIPIIHEEKWTNLVNESKKQSIIDFRNDCMEYCKDLGIKEIEDFLLKNFCMEIPESGILVHKPYPYPQFPHKDSEKVFPFITKYEMTSYVLRKLGHYTIKNGVCTFIYLDGKTYVTKNEVIICILQNSGYIKDDLKTPLLGNETILDNEYAEKWQNLH